MQSDRETTAAETALAELIYDLRPGVMPPWEGHEDAARAKLASVMARAILAAGYRPASPMVTLTPEQIAVLEWAIEAVDPMGGNMFATKEQLATLRSILPALTEENR